MIDSHNKGLRVNPSKTISCIGRGTVPIIGAPLRLMADVMAMTELGDLGLTRGSPPSL